LLYAFWLKTFLPSVIDMSLPDGVAFLRCIIYLLCLMSPFYEMVSRGIYGRWFND
jgi:hypothetical protein